MVTPPPESLFIDTASDIQRAAFSKALRTEKSVYVTENRKTADYCINVSDARFPIEANTILHPYLSRHSLHGYIDTQGAMTAVVSVPNDGHCSLQKVFTPLPDNVVSMLSDFCIKHALTGAWHIPTASESQQAYTLFSAPDEHLLPVFAGLGFNWAAYTAYEAMGRKVSCLHQPYEGSVAFGKNGTVYVPATDIYLDLDDTLLIHGELYEGALALIEYASACSIPIHLITRHYRDPAVTLAEHGITAQTFTSIIWIRDETPKSNFIKGKAPLFIDDAYRERTEVSKTLGIPALPAEVTGLIKLAF